MKISKKDAIIWLEFFASLPEEEQLSPRQQELLLAALAQIEDAVEARNAEAESAIAHLRSLDGRTLYVGNPDKFARGCKSCLLGTGLGAVRKTNRCNAKCPFCYDYGVLDQIPPIGEDTWEIGGTKFRERDLPLLFSVQNKPSGIAYVYLEPMLEIEKYYGVIRAFADAGVHQHLYTNGICANEENLRALGKAGLDEIRFNLGATNCSDRVIENIAIAKKYIPQVGIETPMTPQLFEQFTRKKDVILKTGFDFMNCAELHLNENNICNYEGESLYMHRQGYISPVWSRYLTLQLMKLCDDEGWDIAMHDCSNHTKFARGLNLKAKEGGWFGASDYEAEFSSIPVWAFLPALYDEKLPFVTEEPLPEGFRPGDIVF